MRISLMATGTRGDCLPYVALGARLAERDHDVAIALDEDFVPHAEAAGLRTVPLPLSLTAYLATPPGQRLIRRSPLPLMVGLQRWYHERSALLDAAALEMGEGAEVLIGQYFTGERMQAVADRAGALYAHVFPAPLVPTGEYTHLAVSSRRLPGAAVRRASYVPPETLRWLGDRRRANAFRARLGVAPSRSAWARHRHPHGLTLVPVSAALVPRPADWGQRVSLTGDWQPPAAVRAAVGESLPVDLVAWLDRGESPVYVGLGSMPVLDPAGLLAMVGEVTARVGVRALVTGAAFAGLPTPPHVRVEAAPLDHDRLFLRCRAAVHHGGAGTVHATLRAGLPTVVCAVWGDQPFWGALLQRRGLGRHIPFKRLDAPRLERALRVVLMPPVTERAVDVGTRMRAEPDGAAVAAGVLEDWALTAATVC